MRVTITETVTLSDAAAMVEVARTELKRGGFDEQAKFVRSIEIFSLEDAQYAEITLVRMKRTGNEIVDTHVQHTITMLRNLLSAAVPVAQAS